MRRTKILATLGPASSSEEMIYRLLTAGVDAFRFNFSHGKHEEHARVIAIIRDVATELGRYIPIVGDIQEPKLRIGEVERCAASG
jgi:pyruvate kinase